MKNLLVLVAFLFGTYLNAQQKPEIIKKENNFVFGTSLSFGRTLTPSKGFGLNFGLDFKNESLLGFGLHLGSGSYDAIDLKQNPPLEDIENYDPQTDDSFKGLNYIDGNTKDRVMMNTLYLSKGFKLNKNMIVDIQAGPSVNIYRKQIYTYHYDPPFGSFSGSSPSSFYAKSSETKFIIMGINFRGGIYYRINANTVMSLTPFINFNRETNLTAIQLGFLFGKRYKSNLFKN